VVRSSGLQGGDVGGRDEEDGAGAVRAVSGPSSSTDDDTEPKHADECWRPGQSTISLTLLSAAKCYVLRTTAYML